MVDDSSLKKLNRRELLQRAGAAGLVLAAPGLVGTTGARAALAAAAPKAGGTLRVGLDFGTSTSFDPQFAPGGNIDIARALNIFERLMDYDGRTHLVFKLAESIEPNKKADQWVVKLRPGVTFHDGSPLTADDVIYSYKRILGNSKLEGGPTLSMIDPKGFKKLSATSLLIRLHSSYSDLVSQLGLRQTPIIKAGTTTFATLNGTGPFKFVKSTPSQLEMWSANRNYWVAKRPYVDSVELHNIQDPTARLDALRANQIDAMDISNESQTSTVRGDSNLQLMVSPSDGFNSLAMNTQVAPFNDVRVRQALRLIPDRPQLVKIAQQGLGDVSNDLFFRYDPLYPKSIPQRHQDIDQAKFLLKKAGRPTLDVTLDTADAFPAMLSGDLVFQQQAKAAGLNLNIVRHEPSSYWATVLGHKPFVHDAFSHRPFLDMALQTLMPKAANNVLDTNWDDPPTTKLIMQLMKTADDAKRKELTHAIDEILWQRGGYLIWGSLVWLDAYRKNVQGVTPNAMRTLGDFRFMNLSLA